MALRKDNPYLFYLEIWCAIIFSICTIIVSGRPNYNTTAIIIYYSSIYYKGMH